MNKSKKTREESEAKSFMSGVMVLSLSTLLVKIIGLFFKIPMLSFLGTEGMGYFNSAYEIYALLCVVSTAGLPVALSMLVSSARARSDVGEIKRVFKTARRLFLIIGVLGSLFMTVLASRLALSIGNPDSYFSILAIAPALLFICLASAVRGYCQGFGDMLPTALSQLIEALSKLGLGILFALIAIKKGYDISTVSAFAILGITAGTLLSLIYLSLASRAHSKCLRTVRSDTADKKQSTALKRLVRVALPITLGSLVMGLTRIIDMTLIMRRLQDIGVSVTLSNKIYGAYTTLALPIFSLVPALITPVSMALIPQLTSALERKDSVGQRDIVGNAMRLTTVFAMPASLGLAVFSRPVLEMLFWGQSEAIDISAPLLSVLALSVVFSCLITTTNAILQSYRRVSLPIISMSVGVAVKLVVSYLLIGNSSFGAMGAPIGSLACNLTVTAVNLWFMNREAATLFSMKNVFIKPLIASALSVGSAVALYGLLGGSVAVVISIIAAGVVYVGLCACMGSIGLEDIALLPGGGRLTAFLQNRKLKRNRSNKNDDSGKEKDAFGKG